MRAILLYLGTAAFIILASLFIVDPSRGHDAPSGWKYPYDCCGHGDCAPVEYTKTVDGEAIGNTKVHSGITLEAYKYKSVRPSPDNAIHVCATPDKAMGKEGRIFYCIFVPAGV